MDTSKPKFDPSQPFEAAPEAKPKFDPSQPFEAAGEAPVAEEGLKGGRTSMIPGPMGMLASLMGFSHEAAANKAANAATAGYTPQIVGAGAKLAGGDYTKARDAQTKRLDQYSKDYPVSSAIGTGAGIAATIPLTEAVGSLGALSSLGKGAKAALTGAAMGGLQNPGDTEGVVDPLQGTSRAWNALLGGGLGWAGGKLAAKVGSAPEDLISAGEGLQGSAEDIATRQVGGQRASLNRLARGYNNPDKAKEVGRFIMDNDIATAGASPEDMISKVGGIKNAAWQRLKGVYDAIDASGGAGRFNRSEVADALRDSLGSVESLRDVPGAPTASSRQALGGLINEFEQAEGPATLDEIRALKQMYGANAGYNKITAPPTSEGYRSMERTLSEAINNRAENLSNQVRGNLGQELKDANRQYHMAHLTDNLLQDKLAMQGNNFFSISDRLAGGVGGAAAATREGGLTSKLSAIPAALASALTVKGLRTYGPNVARPVLDNAGNFLEGAGQMLDGTALPAAGDALQKIAPGAMAAFQRDKVNPWTRSSK